MVLLGLNIFLPIQTIENVTLRHAPPPAPISLDGQLIPSLNYLVP